MKIRIILIILFLFFINHSFSQNLKTSKEINFWKNGAICKKAQLETPKDFIYIYGKMNGLCYIKYNNLDCDFPEGEYQRFSKLMLNYSNKNKLYLSELKTKYCKTMIISNP